MYKAIWNGKTIASAAQCESVEGNAYFPPGALDMQYFKPSQTHTTCGWKGVASYYDVEVDGQVNKDCAWFYPSPKSAANNIAGYVAFWRGVSVVQE
jgi:uncharacterized protein (DUF427 family)